MADMENRARDLTFLRMATVIQAFKEELMARNPIGVNAYAGYLDAAQAALEEIHYAELRNSTCDYAGSGMNNAHDICQIIPMQNACNKCVSLEYRRRLDLMAKVSIPAKQSRKRVS